MTLWFNGKGGLTSNTSDEDVLRDFIPLHLEAANGNVSPLERCYTTQSEDKKHATIKELLETKERRGFCLIWFCFASSPSEKSPYDIVVVLKLGERANVKNAKVIMSI
ncbi:chemokine-like protein TAFA-1 isoform X5 [Felis catus]|uniref:chemokine-like protein TAFA-1 isoform X5 n=1 Tax=Felis catus TaxID=9685 RepID=UPI001D1A0FE8|nr:chemokine-like protein TAFA-1 isoform X5 [Felis catus]